MGVRVDRVLMGVQWIVFDYCLVRYDELTIVRSDKI